MNQQKIKALKNKYNGYIKGLKSRDDWENIEFVLGTRLAYEGIVKDLEELLK